MRRISRERIQPSTRRTRGYKGDPSPHLNKAKECFLLQRPLLEAAQPPSLVHLLLAFEEAGEGGVLGEALDNVLPLEFMAAEVAFALLHLGAAGGRGLWGVGWGWGWHRIRSRWWG